jgi:tRNA U38,U39,U40 pseudouridine synthase TruA
VGNEVHNLLVTCPLRCFQIRVFGVQRATEGFDARKFCDKRKYEYILPAWVFDPIVCSHGRPATAAGSGSGNAALQAVAAAVLAAGTDATSQQTGTSGAAVAVKLEAADFEQQPVADESEEQAPAAAAAAAAAVGAAVDDAGDDASGAAAAAAPADESAASCHFDKDKLERIR